MKTFNYLNYTIFHDIKSSEVPKNTIYSKYVLFRFEPNYWIPHNLNDYYDVKLLYTNSFFLIDETYT